MAIRIRTDGTNGSVSKNLEKARVKYDNALEKLSSGVIFTKSDPKPAEKAISETMRHSIRSLQMGKKNASMAISLVQTAEGGLNEISNILIRMKEIAVASANNTVSDKERTFFFIEYESLRNEIDRIADSTEFSGIKVINGGVPGNRQEDLNFLVGALNEYHLKPDENPNIIQLKNIANIKATTENLGLRSAVHLINEEDGISMNDVTELIEPENTEYASNIDEALASLSRYRAEYGAINTRLEHVVDFMSVHEENIQAAQSKITDVDIAAETAKLSQAGILMQASVALHTHGNMESRAALRLLDGI